MTQNANNVLYWIQNKIDQDHLDILIRIKEGVQPWAMPSDRFGIAHMITLECVKPNFEERTLTLTPKGLDAIDFFTDYYYPNRNRKRA